MTSATRHRITFALLLLQACATRVALAQHSELEGLLEESIVSTPSKSAELARSAPATSTIITAEELRVHGITSLDEAIDYLSLGMVTTDPLHAVEIGARGVLISGDYGNHVLLLVDGHALNEVWNGTAYFERGAAIPFELIDHIEVILGPGSVMYGSQAMLGVINVVTKSAAAYSGVRLLAEGDLTARQSADGEILLSEPAAFGSGYRVGAGVGEHFRLFGEPSEATLQLEYYRQEGPDWSFAPQLWGDDSVTGEPKSWGPKSLPGQWGGTTHDAHYTEVPAAYGRLVVGDVTALVRAGMYERATPYLNNLVQDTADFDDPRSHELDRFVNAELKARVPVSERLVMVGRGYADLNQYQWWSHTSSAESCPEGLDEGCVRHLTGTGRMAGAELQWDLSEPELHGSTLLGVDGRVRDALSDLAVSDAASDAVTSVDNDYRQTDGLVAPYLRQSLKPLPWLDLNAGLRLDVDTRFGAKLSPRGAAAVDAWRGGTLKVIFAEAFRAPSSFEQQYADIAFQISAPELGAESVRSIEISVEQRVGTHRMILGMFRSWWFDMVGYAVLDEAELAAAVASGELVEDTIEGYQYRNIASIDSFGYNAGYESTLLDRKLRLGLNVTSAFARQGEGEGSPETPLTTGPRFFGNARASYALGESLPTLAVAAQYLARRPADRALDGGFSAPPYAPADLELRFAVSGAMPGLPDLGYRLSLNVATAKQGAYVIGPYQYAADETTRAELSPMRRLYGYFGLQYVVP